MWVGIELPFGIGSKLKLFQHIIVTETESSSLNFDKKTCKSESEGTCAKQLHFWNTLLLLSSSVFSLHFYCRKYWKQKNSVGFEEAVFQFFSCWKFSILHRLAEEEELRKIGAFDGRRMSEYAQCWPLLGKRQEILYKLYKILGKNLKRKYEQMVARNPHQ